MKKKYGLLGRDIGYSFSRGYFTDKFEKENLELEYHNFDLKKIEDIKEVISNPIVKGLNVTIPYKEEVIPYMDDLDTVANEIGAVNTIKFEKNGTLKGYNSDYYGFTESLKPLLNDSIKKALILGTGGASKAIAYALNQLQITYSFVSRNPKADQIHYADLDEHMIKSNTLIINCTPLGTFPNIQDAPNIPYEYITPNHVLYDLIYNPDETSFLRKGKEKGATICNGLRMLELQAEKSWEIWNT